MTEFALLIAFAGLGFAALLALGAYLDHRDSL